MSTVIYARVSSEDQAERGTIENQIEFGNKYADLHQLELTEIYMDDGVTGTIPLEARSEGKRLMDDAKAGKFDMLLIYKLDRLGRSARIILNAVYELEKLGIKIKSMTEPFDTSDPSGRFLLTILAGVADLERETILDRLWNGANRAARQGKWLGGIVPYGYYKDEEGYLSISDTPLTGFDISEADVIRLIFKLTTEDDMTTIKIADYLNALGVPPSYTKDNRKIKSEGKRKENTAGIWRPARIGNMIKNTTYKGLHGYGKRTAKQRDIIYRQVPAIIEEDIWEQAQAALKGHQLDAMRNAKNNYLLRGLIKCGKCGLTYTGSYCKGPGGQNKGWYICNGKITYRGPYLGKCKSKNVPQEWIEELVWSEVKEYIENPNELLIKAEIQQADNISTESLEKEKLFLLKTLEQKEIEKQSILDLYRKKIIDSKDVEIQLDKISFESDELSKRILHLEESIKNESQQQTQYHCAYEFLKSLQSRIEDISWEEKREIIRLLIKRITINDNLSDNKNKISISIEYIFPQVVNHMDKDSLQQLRF